MAKMNGDETNQFLLGVLGKLGLKEGKVTCKQIIYVYLFCTSFTSFDLFHPLPMHIFWDTWSCCQASQLDYQVVGYGVCESAFSVLLGVNEKRVTGHKNYFFEVDIPIESKWSSTVLFVYVFTLWAGCFLSHALIVRSGGWWAVCRPTACPLTSASLMAVLPLKRHHRWTRSSTTFTGMLQLDWNSTLKIFQSSYHFVETVSIPAHDLLAMRTHV